MILGHYYCNNYNFGNHTTKKQIQTMATKNTTIGSSANITMTKKMMKKEEEENKEKESRDEKIRRSIVWPYKQKYITRKTMMGKKRHQTDPDREPLLQTSLVSSSSPPSSASSFSSSRGLFKVQIDEQENEQKPSQREENQKAQQQPQRRQRQVRFNTVCKVRYVKMRSSRSLRNNNSNDGNNDGNDDCGRGDPVLVNDTIKKKWYNSRELLSFRMERRKTIEYFSQLFLQGGEGKMIVDQIGVDLQQIIDYYDEGLSLPGQETTHKSNNNDDHNSTNKIRLSSSSSSPGSCWGLEHIIDEEMGKRRVEIKQRAIRAVMMEQQNQRRLRQQRQQQHSNSVDEQGTEAGTLSSSSSSPPPLAALKEGDDSAYDTSGTMKIAQVYSNVTADCQLAAQLRAELYHRQLIAMEVLAVSAARGEGGKGGGREWKKQRTPPQQTSPSTSPSSRLPTLQRPRRSKQSLLLSAVQEPHVKLLVGATATRTRSSGRRHRHRHRRYVKKNELPIRTIQSGTNEEE